MITLKETRGERERRRSLGRRGAQLVNGDIWLGGVAMVMHVAADFGGGVGTVSS